MPVRALALGVALTFVAFLGGTPMYVRLFSELDRMSSIELELRDLGGDIRHLDEVLTMSARLSALTGDPAWEQRYHDHEARLDASIQQLRRLATGIATADLIDAANVELVALETKAFERVRDAKKEEAHALLFGARYEAEKLRYSAGIYDTMAVLKARSAVQVAATHRLTYGVFGGGAVLLVLFVAAWWRVGVLVRRVLRARAQATASLEQRVAELAAKNEELRTMQGRLVAQEKMSALGRMLAGIAHEINNPLGVILGFAQGMEKRLEAHRGLELPVRSILREALRCRNLVLELLKFSRGSPSATSRCDVNVIVSGASELLRARARTQGTKLVVDLAASAAHVEANATRLEQVVINLANNSLDALKEGGEVRLAVQSAEGHVRIECADDGPGIAEEHKARLFEPFFTTKPVGKGTGLGLSLVYEIVEQHRGNIEVQSQVGQGTRFSVTLPAT